MSAALTRRAALTGAASAAAALAAGTAIVSTPATASLTGSALFRAKLDAADRSKERFNALAPALENERPDEWQRELEAMIATGRDADRAEPTTWQEFTRWVEHVSDDGWSSIDDDNADRLLSHTRRLAKLEG